MKASKLNRMLLITVVVYEVREDKLLMLFLLNKVSVCGVPNTD